MVHMYIATVLAKDENILGRRKENISNMLVVMVVVIVVVCCCLFVVVLLLLLLFIVLLLWPLHLIYLPLKCSAFFL